MGVGELEFTFSANKEAHLSIRTGFDVGHEGVSLCIVRSMFGLGDMAADPKVWDALL